MGLWVRIVMGQDLSTTSIAASVVLLEIFFSLRYLDEDFSCTTLTRTVLFGNHIFITKGSLLVGVRSVAQIY